MEKDDLRIFVTKADGAKQPFDRKKVAGTCLRMGAAREVADKIAKRIESQIYNGIETKKILQMIFRQLGKYNPSIRYQTCLRRALSLMRPKPDFEYFIQILLSEHGYEVTPNQIIRGRCVEHEIDAIARKTGKTYIVEVKHHYNYHTPTGLDESRIARAVFEDITEGFTHGKNELKIDEAMIVCNTKFSDHAKRYAKCRGIRKIGWSTPADHSLQEMIEEKKLYPIQCLKTLSAEVKENLATAGVILLKQLTKENLEKFSGKPNMPKATLSSIIEKADMIVSKKS